MASESDSLVFAANFFFFRGFDREKARSGAERRMGKAEASPRA
jgi:hypothetical protein